MIQSFKNPILSTSLNRGSIKFLVLLQASDTTTKTKPPEDDDDALSMQILPNIPMGTLRFHDNKKALSNHDRCLSDDHDPPTVNTSLLRDHNTTNREDSATSPQFCQLSPANTPSKNLDVNSNDNNSNNDYDSINENNSSDNNSNNDNHDTSVNSDSDGIFSLCETANQLASSLDSDAGGVLHDGSNGYLPNAKSTDTGYSSQNDENRAGGCSCECRDEQTSPRGSGGGGGLANETNDTFRYQNVAGTKCDVERCRRTCTSCDSLQHDDEPDSSQGDAHTTGGAHGGRREKWETLVQVSTCRSCRRTFSGGGGVRRTMSIGGGGGGGRGQLLRSRSYCEARKGLPPRDQVTLQDATPNRHRQNNNNNNNNGVLRPQSECSARIVT